MFGQSAGSSAPISTQRVSTAPEQSRDPTKKEYTQLPAAFGADAETWLRLGWVQVKDVFSGIWLQPRSLLRETRRLRAMPNARELYASCTLHAVRGRARDRSSVCPVARSVRALLE